ncbi:MAG: hypothetical protein DHS20C21_03370 [Gemmatimonadota bacterium]|nr:MAG: hypothetical protein DHS20C21_03370 [Gemmatimonadota bacterium]
MVWKPSLKIELTAITAVISLFAALLALYWSHQNFMYLHVDVREHLVANILAISLGNEQGETGYEITLAVGNAGNRTAALTGSSVSIEGPGQLGSIQVPAADLDPVAIAPGDIILLKLFYGIAKETVARLGPDGERVRATLQITVLDNEGARHDVEEELGSLSLRDVLLVALDFSSVPRRVDLLPSAVSEVRDIAFVAHMDSASAGRMILMTEDGPVPQPLEADSVGAVERDSTAQAN